MSFSRQVRCVSFWLRHLWRTTAACRRARKWRAALASERGSCQREVQLLIAKGEFELRLSPWKIALWYLLVHWSSYLKWFSRREPTEDPQHWARVDLESHTWDYPKPKIPHSAPASGRFSRITTLCNSCFNGLSIAWHYEQFPPIPGSSTAPRGSRALLRLDKAKPLPDQHPPLQLRICERGAE
jgi:hypothetical protein